MISLRSSVGQGLTALVAWTLINILYEDVQDTFGNAFLYHPITYWICIFTLVYLHTEDAGAGIMVVAIYEIVKSAWKTVNPDPPLIGKVKKLLHRLQNPNTKLSDNDITFLNSITPSDVTITKVSTVSSN
jgi:hypothetical protein